MFLDNVFYWIEKIFKTKIGANNQKKQRLLAEVWSSSPHMGCCDAWPPWAVVGCAPRRPSDPPWYTTVVPPCIRAGRPSVQRYFAGDILQLVKKSQFFLISSRIFALKTRKNHGKYWKKNDENATWYHTMLQRRLSTDLSFETLKNGCPVPEPRSFIFQEIWEMSTALCLGTSQATLVVTLLITAFGPRHIQRTVGSAHLKRSWFLPASVKIPQKIKKINKELFKMVGFLSNKKDPSCLYLIIARFVLRSTW